MTPSEILKIAAAEGRRPDLSALVGSIPYARNLGITVDRKGTEITTVLNFSRKLIGNPMLPALHGGVLAGFGETAMILHLMDTVPGIPDAPRSVDFAIAYMRSAKPVDTFAQCTTVRQGNRVALAQVSIWQDDPQRPVANARGHFLMPREEG